MLKPRESKVVQTRETNWRLLIIIKAITTTTNNNNKQTFIYRHLQENQNRSGLQIEVAYTIA